MFHTPQINSCDLFVPNPAQHFLGIGNTGGSESCLGTAASSSKDISQRSGSEDLFSPATKVHFSEVNDNHTSFHKYIAQKPLFGKSGKYFTKPNIPHSSNNAENDDIESSYQLESLKNLVNLINGLSEKVNGLYNTITSLSTEVKLITGLVENQIKRNDEQINSGQRSAETIHELLGKFEAFFHAYKEHEKVTSENSEIVKGHLKSIKDDALKTSESINGNQEIMQIKLLEAVESVKNLLRQETEQQVNHICSWLLFEIEKKYTEKMDDLKQLVQRSLQLMREVEHEKNVCTNANLKSTNEEDTGNKRCLRSSTMAASARSKAVGTTNRSTSSGNNRVPLMSLQKNLQTCSTVTVQPTNCQTNEESTLRSRKDDQMRRVQNPNGKENSTKPYVRYVPPKRKQGRNCSSSSFIQFNQVVLPSAPESSKPSSPAVHCSSSHQMCDVSDNVKNCKIISNVTSYSQSDSEYCSSILSSQSSSVSISQLPFAKKALYSLTSAPVRHAVRAAPATNDWNCPTVQSWEDRIWM